MCSFTAEARELELHVDNVPKLRAALHSVFRALARKLSGGAYDPATAPRAFKALARTAAREYCRDFASNGNPDRVFPNGAICTYCKEMAKHFESRIAANLLDDMPTAAPILNTITGGAPAALAAARIAGVC